LILSATVPTKYKGRKPARSESNDAENGKAAALQASRFNGPFVVLAGRHSFSTGLFPAGFG
jgi:hypothetical protein